MKLPKNGVSLGSDLSALDRAGELGGMVSTQSAEHHVGVPAKTVCPALKVYIDLRFADSSVPKTSDRSLNK